MSKLLERFGKIKSAVEIRGASNIAAAIMERTEERENVLGRSMDRQVIRRGDGKVMICQRGLFPNLGEATTQYDIKALTEAAGLPWDEAYKDRAYPVWSSDERVNRYGDIDLQQWHFDNYNTNPLVLFSHNWDGLPIGNSIYHKVENRVEKGYAGPALKQVMLFATKEQSEMADSVERLWRAKFLRTVSVGFYPGVVIDVTDPAEREKLGLGRWGMVLGEEELIEVSPTSVPALPSAHASALKDAAPSLKASDIDVVREFARKEAKNTEMSNASWRELDASIRSIWLNLFPDTKTREHLDIDAPAQYDASFASATETKRFEKLAEEIQASLSALSVRVDQMEKKKEVKVDPSISTELGKIDAILAGLKAAKTGV